MKTFDLTYTITENMPVFPGTELPTLNQAFTINKNDYAETRLTLFSHVGTHMDAPAHMIQGGKTLDAYEVDTFVGKAFVLDISTYPIGVGEWCIQLEMLKAYEQQIKQIEFLILFTGWSRLWGNDAYYNGFPALSVEVALWLANLPLKGIGIDAISIDLMSTTTFPIHHIFMEKDMVIIENLTNLEQLANKAFTLSALPIKYNNADGAPIRAIGTVEG